MKDQMTIDTIPDVKKFTPRPIILGVDPGIKNFAYGVIEIIGDNMNFLMCGTLSGLNYTHASRLARIHRGMSLVIQNSGITHAGYEDILFGRNKTAAISTAKAIGAFEMACHGQNISCEGVSPSRLKKYIAGDGRADKEQMKEAVLSYFEPRLHEDIDNWHESVPENDSSHPYWKRMQLVHAEHHAIDAVAVAMWTKSVIEGEQ